MRYNFAKTACRLSFDSLIYLTFLHTYLYLEEAPDKRSKQQQDRERFRSRNNRERERERERERDDPLKPK